MLALLKKILNSLLLKLNLTLTHVSQVNAGETQRALFKQMHNELIKLLPNDNLEPEIVVFSMDRALQLHALLNSIIDNVGTPTKIHVLYRATTDHHAKAFEEVFSECQKLNIYPVKQSSRESFRNQLITILEDIKSEKMFFLVDDDLFIEKFDLQKLNMINTSSTVFSLRMGENLQESYTTQLKQAVPKFNQLTKENNTQDEIIIWIWKNEILDWAYPLSVDGHLFSTKEILAMTKVIEFNSPNTYENNLQVFLPFFNERLGYCFRKSRMVNIPCNKVQDYNDNRHGQIHQDDLLAKWQAGESIDYRKLYNAKNISAHQELNLNFKSR